MKRLFIALSILAAGQSTKTFEAADVRASKLTETMGVMFSGGRVQMRGVTMLDLIAIAYGMSGERVLGGPSWLDTNRYDITAKTAADTPDNAAREMIQSLLAERFKLVVHNEEKLLPVWSLTVSKRGAKLKPSESDRPGGCEISGAAILRTYTCHNTTMAAFVQQLRGVAAAYVDHPAIDDTGLKRSYDFALSWSQRGQLGLEGAVSLYDSIEKQLGLKLESKMQKMSVVVVDHIEAAPQGSATEATKILPPAPTEFEVANVRPSRPGAPTGVSRIMKGGRVEVQGATMKELVGTAYNVDEDRIIGPKWIDSDHFDIIAKAGSDALDDVLQTMLKSLLADRFKLKVHEEEQSIPVYALTAPRKTIKLKESDGSTRSACKNGAGDGKRTVTCENTTMQQFADKLREIAPAYIDHAAVNLTDLKGVYDFTLSWSPRGRFSGAMGRGEDSGQPADPTGDITVFEAIDKQLGLKLAPQKHPMKVIVIDNVERIPTEN